MNATRCIVFFILCLVGLHLKAQQDLVESWEFSAAAAVYTAVALATDESIFFGSDDNQLYALAPDGTLKWTFPTGDDLFGAPVVVPGDHDGSYTVVFGSLDNFVYAVNESGTELWRFETANAVYATPVIHDNLVIVPSIDGYCYAIDLQSGGFVWEYLVDELVISAPVVDTNGWLYLADFNNQVHCLNATTGNLSWKTDLKLAGPSIRPTTENRIMAGLTVREFGGVLVASGDGILYALDLSGSVEWFFRATAEIDSQPVIDDLDTIYFGCRDGYLYALNNEGVFQWASAVGEVFYSSGSIGRDRTIYICGYHRESSITTLYKLDQDGYDLDSVDFLAGNDAPLLITPNGYLYTAMLDGSVIQYDILEPLMESRWPTFRQSPDRRAVRETYRSPFHQWVVQHFGTEALRELELIDDSDNDGIPLEAEFALGLDPEAFDPNPTQLVWTDTHITFSIEKRLSALDVTIAAQAAASLSGLSGSQELPTQGPIHSGYQKLSRSLPVTESSKAGFGRFVYHLF